jgi:pyruvate carboxylase
MRRALAEYDVRGIKTTVPFFRWLLDQPVFRDAAFHTDFLDTLLQQRRGKSFSEAEPSLQEVALIAAALHAVRGTASPPGEIPDSAWTQQAKRENLR